MHLVTRISRSSLLIAGPAYQHRVARSYVAQGGRNGVSRITIDGNRCRIGRQRRLVRVENANTGGCAGLCLEVHDLAISKYVAGRDKDFEITRELARHNMTGKKTLLARLAATRLDATLARAVRGRIERDHPE
jgi:hypothetical protein